MNLALHKSSGLGIESDTSASPRNHETETANTENFNQMEPNGGEWWVE